MDKLLNRFAVARLFTHALWHEDLAAKEGVKSAEKIASNPKQAYWAARHAFRHALEAEACRLAGAALVREMNGSVGVGGDTPNS